MGMILGKTAVERLGPWLRENNRTVPGYNAGKTGNAFISFQGLEKELEPLPLADDAEIGIEPAHEFAGQDGKSAASQDDQSFRMPPDDTDQFPDFVYERFHICFVNIINVSDGQAYNIWLVSGKNPGQGIAAVLQFIHICYSRLMRR